MGNPVGFVLFSVVIVGGVIASMVWTNSRAADLIHGWALGEGYRVVEMKQCWFFLGPFFLNSSKNQMVYFVTVENARGEIRHAWCRCGSWWGGLLSSKIDVRWKD